MVGKSNGTYSSTRKFLPKTKITKDEAKDDKSPEKQRKEIQKLSYDGQVLRIINLQRTIKDYPYISCKFFQILIMRKCSIQSSGQKTILLS